MTLRSADIMRRVFKNSENWHPLTDDELSKLKLVMLEISDDIVSLCEKHGLQYCMAYGTALGSVRHKGYIPWDDDVDFFMPRQDYEKFMHIAEEELGDKYVLRSVAKGDKVKFPTLHMRKKGTLYVNYGDLIVTNNEPVEDRGIYIDIAPLDNSSNNYIIRNLKGYISLFCLFASSCINVKDSYRYIIDHHIAVSPEDLNSLKIKVGLGKLFSIIPDYKWMKFYDNISRRNSNNNSVYLISYCGMKKINKGTYKRKDMFPVTKGEFEGRSWNLPHNPDAYLTIEYNDYMTIPKLENQKIHPVFFMNFDTSKDVKFSWE